VAAAILCFENSCGISNPVNIHRERSFFFAGAQREELNKFNSNLKVRGSPKKKES